MDRAGPGGVFITNVVGADLRYGLVALVLMCISLVGSANIDTSLTGLKSPLGLL